MIIGYFCNLYFLVNLSVLLEGQTLPLFEVLPQTFPLSVRTIPSDSFGHIADTLPRCRLLSDTTTRCTLTPGTEQMQNKTRLESIPFGLGCRDRAAPRWREGRLDLLSASRRVVLYLPCALFLHNSYRFEPAVLCRH